VGNLVAYPYEKMLTRSPEKVVYFPDEVDAIPEKVDELIWLSQILSIKHYELSIEKVLKSCSPCKKMRNEK
jgi:hypothetical protein